MSYRGISLLPTTSKLFTAALAARLSSYLEANKLLSNEQNGFRPNRSCTDHIFTLYNLCMIRRNLKSDTFLSFIDFKKAFDFVNHEFLFHKLLNAGIHGNYYFAVKNVYKHPVSCVQVNGELTDWFEVGSGVRQGDSLSPIFCLLYTSPSPRDRQKSRMPSSA